LSVCLAVNTKRWVGKDGGVASHLRNVKTSPNRRRWAGSVFGNFAVMYWKGGRCSVYTYMLLPRERPAD
jgi:hypothetical protein